MPQRNMGEPWVIKKAKKHRNVIPIDVVFGKNYVYIPIVWTRSNYRRGKEHTVEK